MSGLRRVAAGLRPARGGLRLLLVRVAAMATGCTVVSLALRQAMGGPCGSGACGPEPGALDFVGTTHALVTSAPVVAGTLLATVLAFWLADQVLTAAALRLFDPAVAAVGGVVAELRAAAREHLWTFVRVALGCAVLSGLVLWGHGWLFDELYHSGVARGWTGPTHVALLAVRAGTAAVATAAIGAFGFWCKVASVADRRRRVRRTVLVAARLAWRRPLSGPGFTLVIGLLTGAIGGPAALSSPPWDTSTAGLVVGTLGLLIGSQLGWYWRIGASLQVYGDPALADLRAAPDAAFGLWPPWRVVGWLRSRAWRRSPAAG